MVLLRYNTVYHGILKKPPIYESCIVDSAEKLSVDSLDTCEDKWIDNY